MQEVEEYSVEMMGYKADNAYKNADYYQYGSDNWHFWMDQAKYWEERMEKGV